MNTEFDDKLFANAARLAKDIAPERDLWPEIADAIAAPPRRRLAPQWAQAAGVLLLVAASSILTYVTTREDPVIIERTVPADLSLQTASFGSEHELSSGYKLARTNLQAQMDRELDKLSPAARAGVEQNLQVIRDAITEINAALEQEPGNVLLQELLLRTYREELAVMRKVGGLTQDVMSRNDI